MLVSSTVARAFRVIELQKSGGACVRVFVCADASGMHEHVEHIHIECDADGIFSHVPLVLHIHIQHTVSFESTNRSTGSVVY